MKHIEPTDLVNLDAVEIVSMGDENLYFHVITDGQPVSPEQSYSKLDSINVGIPYGSRTAESAEAQAACRGHFVERDGQPWFVPAACFHPTYWANGNHGDGPTCWS